MREEYSKLSELQFEELFCDYLTTIGGVKQWEYRRDITTTDQLWENLRTIIELNNRNRINGKLSDDEFNQVKRRISRLETPYEAGQFLYGVNGVCQVDITLDNGKTAYLTLFEQSKVGGANTFYQVVNQIERPRKVDGKPNRRFDVTLLINGLPIIQIELKKATNSTKQSLNQMHQYIAERQYSDIFSTVQILIAMAPNDIKYMANTTKDTFNTDFAFTWQDELTSNPIRNWKTFSDKVLSIPMAHDLATNYLILDGTKNKESIKVMRPYQVYATKRVIEAVRKFDFQSRDGKLGYVWHTTGSGKTITSFKTAWLASRLPNVNKVIFLVDRIALTNQTADAYKAYDPVENFEGKTGIVGDTANIGDLKNKLSMKSDKNIIVTSIQKMSRYVKSSSYKPLKDNILFIVDEAHRSTGDGSENQGMLEDIRRKIPTAGWVGYTGTPRFPETTQIFGEPLHVYTIKEAISDRNVLGFNVQFKETIVPPESPSEDDIDDNVKASVYDTSEEHVRLVVKDIFDNWRTRSANRKYNALFTVHVGGGKASTPRAMEYYDAFQQENLNREPEDRLKVAISFSMDTSNSDRQLQTNENLSRAIQNYNLMFGTAYDMTTTKQYTEDITRRLNRTIDDGNFLDLVIVIDQLLTGFDAPQLNTLYIDRTLKGASLIQAYSRTNRIHNYVDKPWGNVINYRWPHQNEEEMNAAFAIYSNRLRASQQLSLDDLKKDNEDEGIIAKPFSEVLGEMKGLIQKISGLTDGFLRVPRSESEQEVLFDDLREYNKLLGKLKQYAVDDDGEPIDPYGDKEAFYEKLGITQDDEVNLTTVIAGELKMIKALREEIDISQVNLDMIHIHDVRINYDYLTELIAKMADEIHEGNMEEAAKTKAEIEVEVAKSDDVVEKSRFLKFIEALFTNKHKLSEYPAVRSYDVINEEVAEYHVTNDMNQIKEFINRWGLNNAVMPKDLKELFSRHKYKQEDLDKMHEITNIMKKAKDDYVHIADEEIAKLKWIHYRRDLRKAIYELADDIVGGTYEG